MIEPFGDLHPRIHADAWLHASVQVLGDVSVAARASVWPTAVLRGDQGAVSIGEATNVQDGAIAHATGGLSVVSIGARCTIGHRAILHGCVVEDDVLVGMGSILLDNCHIEPWCIIGAGAVVPSGMRVPTGSLVLGTPGRVIRKLRESDLERIRHGCSEYLRLAETYRSPG
ncbi:gamma carbonic anhydrase family protein [Deltaproteobacteria bacterium]|nr:gamma carbonic anhydrase family protein [Deltaproteobacteria bacterium]